MARKPPYFPVIAFLHSSQAVWIYMPTRGQKKETGSKKLNVSSMCFFSVRKDSESANSKQEFQIRFFFRSFFFFRLANACTKQMSLTFSRLKHIKEKTSLFFFLLLSVFSLVLVFIRCGWQHYKHPRPCDGGAMIEYIISLVISCHAM